MSEKIFIHVDMDAFFASIEQHDNPSYKGKPVIVGGDLNETRSVVSTCSYEARKFGVHSAMPLQKAYKLCPNGIFVKTNMKRYCEVSASIMEILKNFSPDVNARFWGNPVTTECFPPQCGSRNTTSACRASLQ